MTALPSWREERNNTMKTTKIYITVALAGLLFGTSAQAEAGNGSGDSGTSTNEASTGTGESVAGAGNGTGGPYENEGGTGLASTESGACMPDLICGVIPNNLALCQVFPLPEDDVGILWKDDDGPVSVGNVIQGFSCTGVDEVAVEVRLFYSGDRELILRQTVSCT